MFDIGGAELLLIVLVVLVLFGPKKLPELAQSLGRGMREFKRAQREFTEQINMAVHEEEQRKFDRRDSPRPPENVVARSATRRPAPIPPPPDDQPAEPTPEGQTAEPSDGNRSAALSAENQSEPLAGGGDLPQEVPPTA